MKKSLKVVLIIVACLGSLILLPAVIGMFLPLNHKVTKSENLKYDMENVWLYVTNVQNYPQWIKHIEKVEILSTNPSGLTSWKEYYKGGDDLMFQITECKPYTHLIIKVVDKDASFGGIWIFSLNETKEGCNLTITEDGEIYNPLLRSFARIRGLDVSLNDYVEDLKNGLKHQN